MPSWTFEQTQAINETGKNIIVSAGAGSGKTAVLSERVITKLKNNISLDQLLVLTFTNAAAQEMKERIRKKIRQNNLTQELDKVDNADITTFDAYALSLVKKYSYLLNVSPNIKIIDESIIKLKKKLYLNQIFENLYQAENPLFLKLIGDFTLKDDSNIMNNILKLDYQLNNLYNKTEYLENYIKNYFTNQKLDNYIDEYLLLIKSKVSTLKNQIKNLSFYTDGQYINKIYDVLNPLLNSQSYLDIKINSQISIPKLPNNSSDEEKELKQIIVNTQKEIVDLTYYENIQEIKDTLLKTKDYAEIITQIILKLDTKVNEYKKEKNAYEFIDIARFAINLLKDNKDVRGNLKHKYKEILIDEYQDTNDLQDLFISYIENNNVYMVGDIKQSIYRFRNTNPILFKSKYEKYAKNDGGLKIDLNKNFRSRNQVIESINKIFNQIMDASLGGADYLASHQMAFGNNNYSKIDKENYELEILDYHLEKESEFSKEEVEIFTIAKDIQDKIKNKYEIMDPETNEKRKIKYQDFAILIDRSSSFETYKKIFEYLNIPISIYKDKAISSSLEIILFKHLYNLILSIYNQKIDTNFKYSFMAIARSYLLKINDDELFNIIKNNAYYNTTIYQTCQEIALNLNEKTNEEILEEIINKFDFYEKILNTNNINLKITMIDSLIKVAQNCDELGFTPDDFYEYLTNVLDEDIDIKLALNKESTSAVKIMTIHGSKGLEFPICYYPGLSKKFNIDDLKNLFYFSNNYGLVIPYYENGPKSTILKTLLKNHYLTEEISERLRLFYVALTRAREKMIIITSLDNSKINYKENGIIASDIRLKYNSFLAVLNSLSESLNQYVKEIDINSINLTKNYNLSKKGQYKTSLSTAKINTEEISLESKIVGESHFAKQTHNLYTEEEKSNLELGLKMHEIFENIDFKNPDYSNLNNFEKEKVISFIKTDILKDALDIFKEYEFIYENDKEYHGIIDLLIIKKNYNIIVDYKLKNITDEAYINQLKGYQKYIENLTNKETKIYLYSILDEKLILIK